MKIWSNSNHSKVQNYELAKVNKERALNMNLSFHITTHTKSLTTIKNENQYEFIHFLMLQPNDHSIFSNFKSPLLSMDKLFIKT
jgi:flagellar assembly factor FliW